MITRLRLGIVRAGLECLEVSLCKKGQISIYNLINIRQVIRQRPVLVLSEPAPGRKYITIRYNYHNYTIFHYNSTYKEHITIIYFINMARIDCILMVKK